MPASLLQAPLPFTNPATQPLGESPVEATHRTQKRRLSSAQLLQLADWIASNVVQDQDVTLVSLAEVASTALGFGVAPDSIKSVLQARGVALKTRRVKAPIDGKRDRLRLLAREFAQFVRETGREPSPTLLELARGS